MNQNRTPLFSKLKQFAENEAISFHVPGHKNGEVIPDNSKEYFGQILKLDLTELTGLDDLHAPTDVIGEAENLAADFFKADHTFFLVGGSTAGNLAMILATVSPGDKVIVQRNSHKSIINALELSGAKPVFIAPVYESELHRYTSPTLETLQQSLHSHPEAKAVVLTHPDYFGKTYEMSRMIEIAHQHDIPVLVDEAHGVHFSLGSPFPPSALHLGADVVVQSAHKMAPAMTQSSYLHIKSDFNLKEDIAHYLQLLQSSSPSYPLMASLDIARSFLAKQTKENIDRIKKSIAQVRGILQECKCWDIQPITEKDDFLKITLHVKQSYSTKQVVRLLEKENIFPELYTDNQILFIHGLAPYKKVDRLKKAVKTINEHLKKNKIHATIDISKLFTEAVQELALSYQDMIPLTYIEVPFEKAIGEIAAEAVIPYPPGIPLILKGEKITETHVLTIEYFLKQGVHIQQRMQGMKIFQANKGVTSKGVQ